MDSEEQNLRILELGSELSQLCSEVLYDLDSRKKKRIRVQEEVMHQLEYSLPPVL